MCVGVSCAHDCIVILGCPTVQDPFLRRGVLFWLSLGGRISPLGSSFVVQQRIADELPEDLQSLNSWSFLGFVLHEAFLEDGLILGGELDRALEEEGRG